MWKRHCIRLFSRFFLSLKHLTIPQPAQTSHWSLQSFFLSETSDYSTIWKRHCNCFFSRFSSHRHLTIPRVSLRHATYCTILSVPSSGCLEFLAIEYLPLLVFAIFLKLSLKRTSSSPPFRDNLFNTFSFFLEDCCCFGVTSWHMLLFW